MYDKLYKTLCTLEREHQQYNPQNSQKCIIITKTNFNIESISVATHIIKSSFHNINVMYDHSMSGYIFGYRRQKHFV